MESRCAIRCNVGSSVLRNPNLRMLGLFVICTLSAQSSMVNVEPSFEVAKDKLAQYSNTTNLHRNVALGTGSATVPASSPFFMFSTANPRDSGVFPVLETYFQSIDYVSIGVATADPSLAQRVENAHQYQLPPRLSSVQTQTNNGCSTGRPGLIIYDIEHWSATPQSEQNDPTGSIAQGANIVHAAGCGLSYGTAPDGQFMGLPPASCTPDLSTSIYQGIDWTQVDFLNVQAQRILSDNCGGAQNMANYVSFVTTIANYVRGQNPNIMVSSQLSFRYTPPDTMVSAIQGLSGVADGFYLAYPDNSSIPCDYCSAANLQAVLQAFHS